MKLHSPVCAEAAARKRVAGAFTLPEVLVAMTLGIIFLGAVALTSITFLRGFVGMYNYTDMNMKSRLALDQISRDIRSAAGVKTNSATVLQLLTTNPAVTITYTWTPSTGKLDRQVSGQTATIVLTDCDSWTNSLYQRTPMPNYTNYVASSTVEAKLISMQWRCSRKILGIKLNSETTKESRIVIRN